MTQQPWRPPQGQGGWPQSPQTWGQQQPVWGAQQGRAPQGQPGWGPPQGQPVWGPPQGQPVWGAPVIGPQSYGQPSTASWQGTRPPTAYPPMMGQYAGYQPPPTPPRRNPLRTVLVVLVAVCLVTLAGIVAVRLFRGEAQVTGDYQNEDYRPPAADTNPDQVPIPAETEYSATMQSNPFYDQTVPSPVRCDVDDIAPRTASNSTQEAYLNELTACLMRVWDTTVQKAGYTLPRPTVTVYSTSITTKCGKASDQNAFYCMADQQVYFADNVLDILPSSLRSSRLALDIILGHEFGHALQGRTGILAAAKLEAYDLPEREGDVYQRRLEVQADCLDGIFLNSVARSRGITDADRQDISDTFYAIGDDVLTGKSTVWGNHGLGRTRQAWGEKGLATTSVGVCNTFTASDDAVR